jgi:hypothetical protein
MEVNMDNYEYLDEIPRYKKKSTAKTPKKANHKHLVEPCLIAYPEDWWTKEHLRNRKMHISVGGYCPVCGKIGTLKDKSKWYGKDTVFFGIYQFTESVLTEGGRKEMNPSTRTLPYFEIDDPFAKFVVLPDRKDDVNE